ncbi:cupin domain-containing protein [Candidatus Roizmanbacteria bacterium]|nr:cupin domain-containing protein [Candidatus Roizmanbacteria bacterium]
MNNVHGGKLTSIKYAQLRKKNTQLFSPQNEENEEMLMCIEGEGELQSGETKLSVSINDYILIPRNRGYVLTNKGTTPFKLIIARIASGKSTMLTLLTRQ